MRHVRRPRFECREIGDVDDDTVGGAKVRRRGLHDEKRRAQIERHHRVPLLRR